MPKGEKVRAAPRRGLKRVPLEARTPTFTLQPPPQAKKSTAAKWAAEAVEKFQEDPSKVVRASLC